MPKNKKIHKKIEPMEMNKIIDSKNNKENGINQSCVNNIIMASVDNRETLKIKNDFMQFMRKHKTDNKELITHTCIKGTMGGKFHINEHDLPTFLKLYTNYSLITNGDTYLTEKQLMNEKAPVLVDLDFRYEPSVTTRQHTREDVEDIVNMYADAFNKVFAFDNVGNTIIDDDGKEITTYPETNITAYVMEKISVNRKNSDVTKDGIHIKFTIGATREIQSIIRDLVMNDFSNELEHLKLKVTNRLDDIFDGGITNGQVNWQLYGSTKPHHKKYILTRQFNITYSMDEYDTEEKTNIDYSPDELMDRLVVRKEYDTYPIRSYAKNILNNQQNTKMNNKNNQKKTYINASININNDTINQRLREYNLNTIENIREAYQDYYNHCEEHEPEIREILDCIELLDNKYYDPYDKWIRVGWGLHSTNKSLFIAWINFSSKSSKFSVDAIPLFRELWDKMDTEKNQDEIITAGTIKFWARQENKEQYENIKKKNIMKKMDMHISSSDNDIATVAFNLFENRYRYVQSSRENQGIWYEYNNHRWIKNRVKTIKYDISKTLSPLYTDKAFDVTKKLTDDNALSSNNNNNLSIEDLNCDINDSDIVNKDKKKIAEQIKVLISASEKCKASNSKNNITKELSEIFTYNYPDFDSKLDKNLYLFGFNNGVFDFMTNEFRDGKPSDCITITCGMDYIEYDENNPDHVRIGKEIDTYMEQLFTNENIRKYMWQFMAAILIGGNKNQTFNIFTGEGRNGKSALIEFLNICFGDYAKEAPVQLITSKRQQLGAATPELAQLDCVRFVSMQELSKGDVLNEGPMKQITGGDPISARAMYGDMKTYTPQFEICMCTNTKPEINATDEGTWRRVRIVPFTSKFVNNPKPGATNEFPLIPKMHEKFHEWKQIFMWKLIQIAKVKKGIVDDCEEVLEASNDYRKEQDVIADFCSQKIVKCRESEKRKVLKRRELKAEFDQWFKENNGKTPPQGKELFNYIDKNICKSNSKGQWVGYKIVIEDYSDSESDSDEEA